MILFSRNKDIIANLDGNQLILQSDEKKHEYYISLRDNTGASTIKLARYNQYHRASEVMEEVYSAIKQNKSFFEFPYN